LKKNNRKSLGRGDDMNWTAIAITLIICATLVVLSKGGKK
jgi:hypothetical protein